MIMIFRFRQFDIKHSESLLKVGTDAVLLGALMHSEKKTKSILDIGTGCGIIALMAAQKFSEAMIHAIDIDEASSEEASYNFKNSKFSRRLYSFNTSLQRLEKMQKYDLICSNPPYFETPGFSKGNNPQDIKEGRKKAATQFTLTFEELISRSGEMLSKDGCFWVIIPYTSKEQFEGIASKYGMYLLEEISIRSKPGQLFIRSILCFGFENADCINSELEIYKKDGTRSDDYAAITQEFYL